MEINRLKSGSKNVSQFKNQSSKVNVKFKPVQDQSKSKLELDSNNNMTLASNLKLFKKKKQKKFPLTSSQNLFQGKRSSQHLSNDYIQMNSIPNLKKIKQTWNIRDDLDTQNFHFNENRHLNVSNNSIASQFDQQLFETNNFNQDCSFSDFLKSKDFNFFSKFGSKNSDFSQFKFKNYAQNFYGYESENNNKIQNQFHKAMNQKKALNSEIYCHDGFSKNFKNNFVPFENSFNQSDMICNSNINACDNSKINSYVYPNHNIPFTSDNSNRIPVRKSFSHKYIIDPSNLKLKLTDDKPVKLFKSPNSKSIFIEDNEDSDFNQNDFKISERINFLNWNLQKTIDELNMFHEYSLNKKNYPFDDAKYEQHIFQFNKIKKLEDLIQKYKDKLKNYKSKKNQIIKKFNNDMSLPNLKIKVNISVNDCINKTQRKNLSNNNEIKNQTNFVNLPSSIENSIESNDENYIEFVNEMNKNNNITIQNDNTNTNINNDGADDDKKTGYFVRFGRLKSKTIKKFDKMNKNLIVLYEFCRKLFLNQKIQQNELDQLTQDHKKIIKLILLKKKLISKTEKINFTENEFNIICNREGSKRTEENLKYAYNFAIKILRLEFRKKRNGFKFKTPINESSSKNLIDLAFYHYYFENLAEQKNISIKSLFAPKYKSNQSKSKFIFNF